MAITQTNSSNGQCEHQSHQSCCLLYSTSSSSPSPPPSTTYHRQRHHTRQPQYQQSSLVSSNTSMAASIFGCQLFVLCIVTLCSVLLLTFDGVDGAPSRPLLRGVTIRNWPYADRLNDRYEGFVVDLMNLISEKVGFEYRLHFSPDGKYGTEYNGHINGMIGEVYRNRADFAIADLTVTESRKRYVDFTDPFLENQLSAIVRRDDAANLRTLEDLVTLNELNRSGNSGNNGGRGNGMIAYGTYRTGSTYYHLSKSRDPVAVRMYNWMLRNPQALVSSAKEGFDRVNAGRYAFIVESTFAEYLTGLYCNLTTLYDTRSLYPRQFAIALHKGSPYLDAFNKAIRELRENGSIERLRMLYWTNRCEQRNTMPSPSSLPTGSTAHSPSNSIATNNDNRASTDSANSSSSTSSSSSSSSSPSSSSSGAPLPSNSIDPPVQIELAGSRQPIQVPPPKPTLYEPVPSYHRRANTNNGGNSNNNNNDQYGSQQPTVNNYNYRYHGNNQRKNGNGYQTYTPSTYHITSSSTNTYSSICWNMMTLCTTIAIYWLLTSSSLLSSF